MQVSRSFYCWMLLMIVSFSLNARTIESCDTALVFQLPANVTVCYNADTAIKNVDAVMPVDSVHHKKNTSKDLQKRKLVSAVFAFPFPFGFMGAHRVMLGTEPWVPIVYVATFGGCFGLLPLIDFFVITFSKDITQYENNPHVFMWVK